MKHASPTVAALALIACVSVPARAAVPLLPEATIAALAAELDGNRAKRDVEVFSLQHRMRGENLRAALVTRGGEGCRVVTETERLNVPAFTIDAVDPTGAGDAFVAGVAWGMAQRWPWPETARFANAVGALACCSLGAQAALPTMAEVETFLAAQPALA